MNSRVLKNCFEVDVALKDIVDYSVREENKLYLFELRYNYKDSGARSISDTLTFRSKRSADLIRAAFDLGLELYEYGK